MVDPSCMTRIPGVWIGVEEGARCRGIGSASTRGKVGLKRLKLSQFQLSRMINGSTSHGHVIILHHVSSDSPGILQLAVEYVALFIFEEEPAPSQG